MNALPAHWRKRRRFTVLETGFGAGTRFLATWAAWHLDADRPGALHFISVEPAPICSRALAAQERHPSLAPLAAELVAAWPPLTPDLHRLSFEGGAVQLWLAVGAVEAWLPQLGAEVDAFYLGGAGTPEWPPRLFKAMARLAAQGATVSVPTAAPDLRRGLVGAGFALSLAGRADEGVTEAVYAPRFVPRPAARRPASPRQGPIDSALDPVVVVGAGLAGCAVAGALAELGRSSIVVERRGGIAEEASGNAAGLFHGVVHAVDGRHARFFRAAALAARAEVAAALLDGVKGSTAGLLRLEPAKGDARAMAATLERLGLPADYVQAMGGEAASACAGTSLSAPAWFYPGGGWVAPRELCAWWLRRAGPHTELRTGCQVSGLRRLGGRWQLLGADGEVELEAGTVVLAHAGAGLAIEGVAPWPIERSRGQLSSVDAGGPKTTWPRLPVAGAGYVLPPIEGRVWFGASTQRGADATAPREGDRDRNLARLRELLPALPPTFGTESSIDTHGDRVAFRYGTADRLPIVGAVADAVAVAAGAGFDRVHRVPRLPGLFILAALGSRGIATAAIGSRVVAASITGTTAPLAAELLDAIDPARFIARAVRRGRAARPRDEAALQPPVGPAAGSAGG